MIMKLSIRKNSILDNLVYLIYLTLPFTLVINTYLLANVRLMGVGILNVLFDCVFVIVFLRSFIRTKLYVHSFYAKLFFIMLFFLTLIKFILFKNKMGDFIEWLSVRQYYFILPLVYTTICNRNISLRKIIKVFCYETLIICPVSIVLFIQSEYYGMVSERDLLKYDIVGTPFARMFSIFGSPLVAGLFFCLMLIFIVSEFDFNKGITKILLFLNSTCLILSFSRAAFIAFITFCIVKLIMKKNINAIWKIGMLSILILSFFLIIVFLSHRGFYFWTSDIFDNIRIIKWVSNLPQISENWILGNNFTLRTSVLGTWETTLSDNSFLIAFIDYGILFWGIVGVFFWVKFRQMKQNVQIALYPIIIVIIVFMFLYDFIQVFPCNYISLIAYKYYKDKEEEFEKNKVIKFSELSVERNYS